MSENLFLAAYDGVDLTLPDGRVVRAKPMRLKESARFLELTKIADVRVPAATAENAEERRRILAEADAAAIAIVRDFPAAIGLEAELDGLHPTQLFPVLRSFFSGAGLQRKTPATETTQSP